MTLQKAVKKDTLWKLIFTNDIWNRYYSQWHCQTLCSDCSSKLPFCPIVLIRNRGKKNRIRYLRQIVLVIRYLDCQTQKNHQHKNSPSSQKSTKKMNRIEWLFRKGFGSHSLRPWKWCMEMVGKWMAFMAEPTNINSCNNVNIVISEIMTIKIIIIGAGI